MWVSLVENGELENDGTNFFVKRHISNLLDRNSEIDTVVLACTHFPLLINNIRRYLPERITILDQGTLVSKRLVDYLDRHPEINNRLTKEGKVLFLTTEKSGNFDRHATTFYGQPLKSEQVQLGH